MRTAACFCLLLCGAIMPAGGQQGSAPRIEWQRTFGGTNDDTLTSLEQTSDGGFILGGYSYSGTDGNKDSTNFGGADFWVLRLDANGNRVWEKSFGGSDNDFLYSLQQTSDGGYIVGGSSRSGVSGNKTAPNFGFNDFWVVRLDAQGGRLWDISFGGSSSDYLQSLAQAADGGFVLGGYSASGTDGDKTAPNLGNNDFWLVRLDANRNKIWDLTFGGGGRDALHSLQQTSDGGFVLGGDSTWSANGNKTSPVLGATDFWIVRLDSNGNKLWDRSFGGTNDDFLNTVQQTGDGGFLLGGTSASSTNGNKTSPNFGGYDFWLVRLDASGNELWDRSFGGSANDGLNSVQQTADGGSILGGYSASGTDGNKTNPNLGLEDFWVVRTDAGGNKLWEQTFGGAGSDSLHVVRQTADGGFILGGQSSSGVSGSKSRANFGGSDFWVVKLAPEPAPRLQLRVLPQTQDEIRSYGFRFLLIPAGTNGRYAIEFSTNLPNWTPLQTNQATQGQLEITDAAASNSLRRLYRARQLQ
jgi:hypothetical protein